ncbi:hypothetical protein FOCC_FOCC003440 [Frankliniella occidentalis]|nr:hypothetical protein FOCC_FOCC003440 [Frankliniella occidentalis]
MITRVKKQLVECFEKMRTLKEDAIKEILEKLPEKHRLAVETIIMASKVDKAQNRRTLQRYIKKLKPAFGFHEPTFKLMEKKKQHLTEAQRHGALLIDEMAMDEGLHFENETLQMIGFVTLGSASPENAHQTLGDHALAFIFQPFQGQWFQAIGAFCSRGAAKGPELEKLTTEAILLLEKHGYFVDVVTTDGGSWNRNMWSLFGISEESVSCRHPTALEEDEGESGDLDDPNSMEDLVDPSDKPTHRRLRFCSDFPHLVKSIWSRVRSSEILQTPDGKVKLDHWRAVVKHDSIILKHITNCWKLTEDHINPTTYQAMNVQMAFQFFSEDVARAMEHYRDKMQVHELHDSQATVSFIRKVNKLIKAMNAKDTWDSLTDENDNTSKQAIQEFIEFLNKWKAQVPQADLRLAWQTHLGLMVTLKGALELVKYLVKYVGYKYLMTRKLNQDALEHFFGNIRANCGSNDHPDPKQFIQVFRLLQTASLIKPPRGSNVTGGEMLESLTSLKEVIEETDIEKKIKFEEILDNLLDVGGADEIMENHFIPVNSHDHSYHFNCTIDEYAFEMFAGYVARKARSFSVAKKCDDCFKSLLRPNDLPLKETQYLIEKRSKGNLLVPSDSLRDLLYQIESVLLSVFSKCKMNRNILLNVLDEVKYVKLEKLVGCEEHKQDLSKAILRFFLTTRMHFACRRFMKQNSAAATKKKRGKALLKQLKLNAAPAGENGVPEEEAVIHKKIRKRKSKKKDNPQTDQTTSQSQTVIEESVWDDMGINWADLPDGSPATTDITLEPQDNTTNTPDKSASDKTDIPAPTSKKQQPATKAKPKVARPKKPKQSNDKQKEKSTNKEERKRKHEEAATKEVDNNDVRRSKRSRKTPTWQMSFTKDF